MIYLIILLFWIGSMGLVITFLMGAEKARHERSPQRGLYDKQR